MKYRLQFGMTLLAVSFLFACEAKEDPVEGSTKGGSPTSSGGSTGKSSGGSTGNSSGGSTTSTQGGSTGSSSGGSTGSSSGGSTGSSSGGSTGSSSGGSTAVKSGGATGSGGSTVVTPEGGTTATGGTTAPVSNSGRIRLIVSSDIGGTDTDDYQSMAHFLTYTDLFDVEGMVASPWGAGRSEDYLEAIVAYEKDYPNLKTYADYPTPDALRAVVKQGATNSAGAPGYTTSTEGSKWIIECANRPDPRPLWIIIWGGFDDMAQALHDGPEIAKKIRVYWIGGPNKKYSGPAYDYVRANHKDLWIIESNTTYRGFFNGGNTSGDLSNSSFASQHVKGHGAIGAYYWAKRPEIKMGDTPSLLYVIDNEIKNPGDPMKPGWGGQFIPLSGYSTWWTDDTNPSVAEGQYPGAKHVSKWREQFLRDWQPRMDRCVAPKP